MRSRSWRSRNGLFLFTVVSILLFHGDDGWRPVQADPAGRQATVIRIRQQNPVVNENKQLALNAVDAGDQPLSGVAWESGSPDIASVNPTTGVVTGVARGFATITARRGSDSVSTFVVVARVENASGAQVPGDTKTDVGGRIYITDPLGNVVMRKTGIGSPAVVFAGQKGSSGRIDGSLQAARFAGPTAVAVDNSARGGVYVADTLNHSIRKIDFDNLVRTILGTGSPGRMTADATPFPQVRFNGPRGVAADEGGNLYVADTDNHAIFYIDFEKDQVRLIAGEPGMSGKTDGRGRAARFNRPSGISLSADGNTLVVADTGNNRVRLVTRAGVVATLGKVSGGRAADLSALRTDFQSAGDEFDFPAAQSVGVDGVGNIYVVDASGARVVTRKPGQDNQLVNLAQEGSFGQATSLVVRGTESFVLDNRSTSEADALKVVTVGGPVITSLGSTVGPLEGGQSLVVTGGNFAPESVVVLGDQVITDAKVESATQITIPRIPLQAAPGNRTLSVQTRGGTAQQSFSVLAKPFRDVNRGEITTVVGGVPFIGDGGAATRATFNLNGFGGGVTAIDSTGKLLIADSGHHRLREIGPSGIVTTLAGTGTPGFRGDGGPAIGVRLHFPTSAAIDPQGNIFICDSFNNRVRRIDAFTGNVTTVAGNGLFDFGDDDIPATQSSFAQPNAVAVDEDGDLYIVDSFTNRIRYVEAATGLISTIAGNGEFGYSGDGGPAEEAQLALDFSGGIALDQGDGLLIADTFNNRVRRVDLNTGIITTIAGKGPTGSFVGDFGGDDGPAVEAELNVPVALAVDEDDNVFIADLGNGRIRRIDAETKIITTVAGDGEVTPIDGVPATESGMLPAGIVVDGFGNLFISDDARNLIRRVDAETDIITTIAGGDGTLGDGGPAVQANLTLFDTTGLTLDAAGNLFLTDDGNHRVRRVEASTGIIATIAGSGDNGYSGDGGPATRAALSDPSSVAVDAAGNVFIADSSNSVIRRIDGRTGVLTTFAGNGEFSFAGDGGPATQASLNFPTDVGVDTDGNVFIADSNNNRIRRVDAKTSVVTTVAGSGPPGEGDTSGDGGPATSARLRYPRAVTVDAGGNLFVSDRDAGRIRRVDAKTGIISTVVGGGERDEDNIPATQALIYGPHRSAVDPEGNLYFAETYASRVRRVDAKTGVITTVVGNPNDIGYDGDGGPATLAALATPQAVALDKNGNLYILDVGNDAVRVAKGIAAPSDDGDKTPPTVSNVTLSKTTIKRKKDATLGVSWRSTDDRGVVSQDLDYFYQVGGPESPTFVVPIVSGLSGSAQGFTWTVPGSVPKNKNGKIGISAKDAAGNVGTASSGVITVK